MGRAAGLPTLVFLVKLYNAFAFLPHTRLLIH